MSDKELDLIIKYQQFPFIKRNEYLKYKCILIKVNYNRKSFRRS